MAKCVACAQPFRQDELGSDVIDHRGHLCPQCQADLSESLRGHLYTCARVPAEMRRRARDARDAVRKLIMQRTQARDRGDVLMREAEAAIAALRDAMRLAANAQ